MRFSVNIKRLRRQNGVRRKLPFPSAPNLRVAQLGNHATFDSVQAFPPDRWADLEMYRPRVLVGSAPHLKRLAERIQRRAIELSSVDHAIFALTECGHKPINDVFRVTLWQTFGVPVYELFIGDTGNLLASECELHEGWHAEPNTAFSLINDQLMIDTPARNRIVTGLTGDIQHAVCPCGRTSARVLDIRPFSRRRARQALAATA